MRTSAPSAFASSSVPVPPGTRIMSPKQVKITFSRLATAMPSSTRPIGITQTGHPGPCTSSTIAGDDVSDEVDHHVITRAAVVDTTGEIAFEGEDVHLDGFVGAGDAVVVRATVGHSITLAFRSSSSCS